MSDRSKTKGQLLQEIQCLHNRLEESEAALEAIRSGEVDALVVSSAEGDQIFTLQGAEHPYRVMVETMNEGAATLLEDGIILYANPRLAEILGEPLETLIGSSILDFITPEDSKVFEGLVEQGFHSSSRGEIRLRSSGQSFVPVLISFSPTQAAGAQALCLVATDLTEQKRGEEILAAERLTRSILEQAGEAIFVCDTNGEIIRANQAAYQICTHNPIFQSFEDALPLIFKNVNGERGGFSVANVLAGENFREVEAEYTLSQGQNRFFLLSAAPLLNRQEQIIGCIVTLTEMTELKRAEAALQESEYRFRAMADGTPLIMWITGSAGELEFINRAYREFFEVTLEEVQSRGWQSLVHPEDTAGYVDVFMECQRERQPFRAQARFRRGDGQWRWLESFGQPRFSEAGDYLGLACSSLDINDRKQVEEVIRSYSAQLERSNKELQNFAFIASHDLQEPLRKIEAFSSRIGKRSPLEETDREYLLRIQDAARRMRKMIDALFDLLQVTTHGKPYEWVDLNEVANTVVDDLGPRIRESRGQVALSPLPVIQADAMQIHLLLQNLLANALKFHRPDLPPIIQVGYRETSPGWVEIYVQDNGIGFEMSYADQIFLPFRRLQGRSEFEGSGIGLPICRKIAERHGGQIHAQSVPGAGSKFSILLPVKQMRE